MTLQWDSGAFGRIPSFVPLYNTFQSILKKLYSLKVDKSLYGIYNVLINMHIDGKFDPGELIWVELDTALGVPH
jgi:hypothetical protein